MEGRDPVLTHSNTLLTRALQNLQEPCYNPEKESQFEPIANILRNSDALKRLFNTPTSLDYFIQLARFHLNYDVYEFGEVLIKPKTLANKFSIVLRGQVQKLQPRQKCDVEQEYKDKEARRLEIEKEQREKEQREKEQREREENEASSHRVPEFQGRAQRKRTLTWVMFDSPRAPAPILTSLNSPAEIPSLTSMMSSKIATKPIAEVEESPPLRRNTLMPATLPSLLELDKTLSLSPNNSMLKRTDSMKKSRRELKTKKSLQLKLRSSNSKVEQSSPENPSPTPSPRKMLARAQTVVLQPVEEGEEKNEVKIVKEEKVGLSVEQETAARKVRMEAAKENNTLVQEIVNRRCEMKQQCLWKEVPLVSKGKAYNAGDTFAESVLKEEQPRENGLFAVASEEVHLITLTRESFQDIMSIFNNRTDVKGEYFRAIFSEFHETMISRFSQYFEKRTFLKGDVIYKQGEPTKELYLLRIGEVKLTKESGPVNQPQTQSPNPKALPSLIKINKKFELPIAVIRENQIFGEEVLLEGEVRQFTATANSLETEGYSLTVEIYEMIKEQLQFKKFFEMMRSLAQGRFEWRRERLSLLMEHQSDQRQGETGQALSNSPPKSKKKTNPVSLRQLGDVEDSGRIVMTDYGFPGHLPTKWNLNSPSRPVVAQSPDNSNTAQSHRLFTKDSPTLSDKNMRKTFGVYKEKFARKIQLPERKALADIGSAMMRETDKMQRKVSFGLNLENGLEEEFNIRKELGGTEPSPRKLSSIKKLSPTQSPSMSPRSHVKGKSVGDKGLDLKSSSQIDGKKWKLDGKSPEKSATARSKKFIFIETDRLREELASPGKEAFCMSAKSQESIFQTPRLRLNLNRVNGLSVTHDKKKLRKLLKLVNCQNSNGIKRLNEMKDEQAMIKVLIDSNKKGTEGGKVYNFLV